MAPLDCTNDRNPPLPKVPGYREAEDDRGNIILVHESEGNKDERQPKKTGSGHEKTSQMSLWEYVYSKESKRWHEDKFTDGSLNHLVITTSSPCTPFREDDDYIDTNGKCILVAARHRDNSGFPNDWIAVKKILLRGSEQTVNEAKKKFRQEIHNMQDLAKRRHHHIIAFIGSYEKGELMGIAMFPVAKYSLKHLLEDMSRKNGEKKVDFSEHHHVWAMLRYFLCLSSAVAWLHSIPVKHKDIKPANILIDRAQSIILADFGLSRVYESKEAADISGGQTEYTLTYAAPEAIDSTDRDLSTDLFSLACVFLEMITVICGETVETLREKLRWRAHPYSSSERSKCYASSAEETRQWINFLKGKSTHPAAQPFLVEGLERVSKMMSRTPRTRGDAKEAHECFKDIARRAQTSSQGSNVFCEHCAVIRVSIFFFFCEDRRHANCTLTSQPPVADKSDAESDRQTTCAPNSAARPKTAPGILQSDLVGTPTSIRSGFLDIPSRAPPSIPPLPKAAMDVAEMSEPIGATNTILQESTSEDPETTKPSKSGATYSPSKPSSELTAVSTPSRNMSKQPSSDTMIDHSIDGPPTQQLKKVDCIVRKNGKFYHSVKLRDNLPGERVILWDVKKSRVRIREKNEPDCKSLVRPLL